MIIKYRRKYYFYYMYFRLIQAVFISIAFAGWVIYQLAVCKKRFSEISSDVLAIVFFVAVWFGLCYWLLS